MQKEVLKTRIKGLLPRDGHAREDGSYLIRSLYFDDYSNSCYFENEAGVGERDKYRIRIYNASTSKIILERKSKHRGMTLKVSDVIDENICRQLMAGQKVEIQEDMSPKLKQLLTEMNMKNMYPVVIVEYIRYPFIYKAGNVRVTFDENIRSSAQIDKFLDPVIEARPILEKGRSVLEVKWDEYIPDFITGCLQLDSLQWTSFSKYYLCRKYNNYGGLKI